MSKAINRPEKQGCTPTSSKCVIWNGPDIPCIDLCQGDSIDEVVYKLAEQLCYITENVIDITKLDLTNLSPTPTTWVEMIQALINASPSVGMMGMAPMMLGATTPAGDIILPEELQYTDEKGDLITALPPNDYSAYLAEKIVEIINDVASLQSNYTILNTKVTVLEGLVDGIKTVQETQDPLPSIVSQCASNTSPGILTPIDTAFTNFEADYCNYKSVIGSDTEITNAINNECANLSDTNQITYPALKMSDMGNWKVSPATISDSITNMWLTICDIRNSLQSLVTQNSTQPCILAVPENFEINSYDAVKAVITWTKANLSGIKNPIGYVLEVYNESGGNPVGSMLTSKSYYADTTSTEFSDASIVAGKTYYLKLKALYDCGESNYISTTGILLGTAYFFKIAATEITLTTDPYDCYEDPSDPMGIKTSFTYITKRTTLELQNASTGLPVINNTATSIDVLIEYDVNMCGVSGTSQVVVSIPSGSTTGYYEYVSDTMINCGIGVGCIPVTKTLSCGVSISNLNTQFDGVTISQCP